MGVKVLLPTALRAYANNQDTVAVEGKKLGDVVRNLIAGYPQLRAHLLDDTGNVRNFVNVYLNDEDIRYLQKEQTPVSAGDTISIIPSVAGGVGNE